MNGCSKRGKQDTGVHHPWDRHKSEVTWLLYMPQPTPHLHTLLSALVTKWENYPGGGGREWGTYLDVPESHKTRPPHRPPRCAQLRARHPTGVFILLPEPLRSLIIHICHQQATSCHLSGDSLRILGSSKDADVSRYLVYGRATAG